MKTTRSSSSIKEAAGLSTEALLSVRDLRTVFQTSQGTLRAVDGLSLSVRSGETVGLVGESGCGKSVTALSILRLVPPPGRILSGSILFKEQSLLELPREEIRRIRGSKIGMIFQEPMTSLNPVYTIGEQIAEVLRLHKGMNQRQAREEAVELLNRVHIPDPARRAKEYPHQLSGGQRQRVMIAMTLAGGPELLLADEPTTALDVTIQAGILDLLWELKESEGMAMLLITHDLGVVAEMADRVVVMYAGAAVEEAPVEELFSNPLHPYTQGLIASVPTLEEKTGRLADIPGTVRPFMKEPAACRFAGRCLFRKDVCEEGEPELREIQPGHLVRCCRTFGKKSGKRKKNNE